jgi:hypothetical protein
MVGIVLPLIWTPFEKPAEIHRTYMVVVSPPPAVGGG